ncbi:hypothetical protein HOY80DRAFT_942106 [Tuber brumale]|nr:hypothetical protein HOY80DRAFT_942106 [Tuber brumale]
MFKLLNKQILKPMRIHNYHPVRRIGTTPRHNIESCEHDSARTRIARLEKEILGVQTRLGQLESEQKDMRADLKSGFRDLSKEMGKGFEGAEKRFRDIEKDFKNRLSRSFERIDKGFDEMSERTDKGSDRMPDRTDRQMGHQGKTFDSLDKTFDEIRYKLEHIGSMATVFGTNINRTLRSSLL